MKKERPSIERLSFFVIFVFRMEEKKLYPMRFCPVQDEYEWGSEKFLLADLGYRDTLVREGWLAANRMSEVMETYMDRVVGDNVYEFYGRQFPVCVRHLTVKGRMPLRVSPDDVIAGERYDLLGKEKLWYVLRCGSGARVMLGFKEDSEASAVYDGCIDGSVGGMLNVVAPHAGQWFHIPPGTAHAAQGDIEIIEVAESSPVDICMCGWGREVSTEEFDDSLTLIDALDFINYKAYVADAPSAALIDIPQFKVEKLDLKAVLHSHSDAADSFVLYVGLSGSAAVQVDVLGQTAAFSFGPSEAMLLPAECNDFRLAPCAEGTSVLEIEIPHIVEKDSYLDPQK